MNETLKQACDVVMTDVYNQLLTLQEKYRTEEVVEDLGVDEAGRPITRTYKRNKYFQLLPTHSIIPADNVKTAPDIGNKKPTDQEETLNDFGLVLPDKMPCSIATSPYQNDIGWGFELRGKVIDGGKEYTRVMNYGNEAHRDTEWWKE